MKLMGLVYCGFQWIRLVKKKDRHCFEEQAGIYIFFHNLKKKTRRLQATDKYS